MTDSRRQDCGECSRQVAEVTDEGTVIIVTRHGNEKHTTEIPLGSHLTRRVDTPNPDS